MAHLGGHARVRASGTTAKRGGLGDGRLGGHGERHAARPLRLVRIGVRRRVQKAKKSGSPRPCRLMKVFTVVCGSRRRFPPTVFRAARDENAEEQIDAPARRGLFAPALQVYAAVQPGPLLEELPGFEQALEPSPAHARGLVERGRGPARARQRRVLVARIEASARDSRRRIARCALVAAPRLAPERLAPARLERTPPGARGVQRGALARESVERERAAWVRHVAHAARRL